MTVLYQHDEHVRTKRRWQWLEFTRLDEIERNRPQVKKMVREWLDHVVAESAYYRNCIERNGTPHAPWVIPVQTEMEFE